MVSTSRRKRKCRVRSCHDFARSRGERGERHDWRFRGGGGETEPIGDCGAGAAGDRKLRPVLYQPRKSQFLPGMVLGLASRSGGSETLPEEDGQQTGEYDTGTTFP